MELKPFSRKVHYYETDMMGITHHANYIHWMEEARIDMMDQIGWSYARMEKDGILSPVTDVSVSYKKPTTFNDQITVRVICESYNGVIVTFRYEMLNEAEETVCIAHSKHTFMNPEHRLIRMRREVPELHTLLMEMAENEGK